VFVRAEHAPDLDEALDQRVVGHRDAGPQLAQQFELGDETPGVPGEES
jgi:hypothetical protein